MTADDGTSFAILTEIHAIEVDFVSKWGEAIGQSLNFGFQFNRKAGIILNLETPLDRKHLVRVNSIVRHYDLTIDVLKIGPQVTNPPTKNKNQNSSSKSGGYWISLTKKTHKKECRYYGKGSGKCVTEGSGANCKICGGAKE